MFTVKIKTDGAAFEGENRRYEVCRILKELQFAIEHGLNEGPIHDITGNRVGEFRLR